MGMESVTNESMEEGQEKLPTVIPPSITVTTTNASTTTTNTPPAPPPVIRVPVKHTNLGIRSHAMDMSTMVELTSFSTLGKIQPFLVTISTTAALVVDLHCHLTDKEVCGYLGGHWDINTHNLSITAAFPCRYAGKDKSAAAAVEGEISRAMEWKRTSLVGWYHSHPRSHASPSLRDVDAQLDYQIKMKGNSDNGYTPCVGLICSPYNADGNCYESNFNIFWSLPPPENRPHEYPRPMLLSYSLSQEHFLPQDALEEIRRCIEYYKSEGGIDFTANFNANTTYLERLRNSLASKLPGRNRTNGSYWDIIREMICPGSEDLTSDPYLSVKFPLITTNEGLTTPAGLPPGLNPANAAVFLTPVNFKPDNNAIVSSINKSFGIQPSTSRDNINKNCTDAITTTTTTTSSSLSQLKDTKKQRTSSDIIPTFQSGELTVSVKNTPSYEFNPLDFTKINPLTEAALNKARASAPPGCQLDDIIQQIIEYSDLTKMTNFSQSDLAKHAAAGFSIADFARNVSPSAGYPRSLGNLFGNNLSKMPPIPTTTTTTIDLERSDSNKPSNDFTSGESLALSSKASTSSTESSCRPDDFISERKKLEVQGEGQNKNFSQQDDIIMTNVKSDFGTMLDMSMKKNQNSQPVEISDSLNLSKDRN